VVPSNGRISDGDTDVKLAPPLVSVGLPVYNGALYVARALDSLLAQDLEDFEIVICDNDSQDSTSQICAEYTERDPRIRYFRNPRNLGLAGNFNRTFELSQGKYFKWAAHDDWHAPESLRLTVEQLERNPSAVVCSTGVAIVDEHGAQFDEWIPTVDLQTPAPHERVHRLIWTLGETHPMYGLLSARALRGTHLLRSFLASDRTLLAELALLGPMVQTSEVLHFYTVSAKARANYRPSVTYDPANRDRLPLRTWRLIYEHLKIVERSDLKTRHKLLLAGDVLARFGGRDFRRLAAEAYQTGRILSVRTPQRWRGRRDERIRSRRSVESSGR
jgi:glycosyltransferase involved in cell wall biosynthesis